MKNKILILLLALLSVIVFASCSQNETDTNINTNTNTDTSTDTDTDTAIEYIIEKADGFTIDTTEQMIKLYRDISNETENIDISKAITV